MTELLTANDLNVRRKIAKSSSSQSLAILPIGSIEQHGEHLPLGTDSIIAEHIAYRLYKSLKKAQNIKKNAQIILLPAIWYTNSHEHSPFFQLSSSRSSLKRYVSDICLSLLQNNVYKIILINGHYGNQKALSDIPKTVSSKSKGMLKLEVLSYWNYMPVQFDHAGHVETSLMLAIDKSKVDMKKAKKGLMPDKNLSKQNRGRISKKTQKSFISITKNGIWGDPTTASASHGRILISEIITNLTKQSQNFLYDKR